MRPRPSGTRKVAEGMGRYDKHVHWIAHYLRRDHGGSPLARFYVVVERAFCRETGASSADFAAAWQRLKISKRAEMRWPDLLREAGPASQNDTSLR